jgi:hypothetical protein
MDLLNELNFFYTSKFLLLPLLVIFLLNNLSPQFKSISALLYVEKRLLLKSSNLFKFVFKDDYVATY